MAVVFDDKLCETWIGECRGGYSVVFSDTEREAWLVVLKGGDVTADMFVTEIGIWISHQGGRPRDLGGRPGRVGEGHSHSQRLSDQADQDGKDTGMVHSSHYRHGWRGLCH